MMRRLTPAFVIFLLTSCDGGEAAKKDDVKAEERAEEKAEELADSGYPDQGDSTDTGYVIEVAVDDDGFDEHYGDGDEDDGGEGDDDGGEGGVEENVEPAFHHKRPKLTGKAAKIEKQIVKEQIEHDVEQVQKLLKELDEDLAQK
jgi:hypothetical protein